MAAKPKPGLGNRIAPPRFLAFIVIALAAYAIVLSSIEWGRAVLIGFDVGAIVFLLSCIPLLRHQADAMRAAAQ
ncbi:MAG: DUF1345 domain-containing protein, partial [Sphingomonadales bacterium]